MRLHRFYIPERIGSQKEISINSADQVSQIRKVFRLKIGDKIIIFDGSGLDFECIIDSFSNESKINSDSQIRLHIATTKRSVFLPTRKIFLYVAMVKKDTFEWIVEKATELGVTHIIPVMAERSEKKNINLSRLVKISIEASEQSGRGSVPEILPMVSLEEAVRGAGQTSAFSFHTSISPETSTKPFSVGGDVALFIGPEGGWSPAEIELFHKNKIPLVSLGSQVFRTETAVVAALSIMTLGN